MANLDSFRFFFSVSIFSNFQLFFRTVTELDRSVAIQTCHLISLFPDLLAAAGEVSFCRLEHAPEPVEVAAKQTLVVCVLCYCATLLPQAQIMKLS